MPRLQVGPQHTAHGLQQIDACHTNGLGLLQVISRGRYLLDVDQGGPAASYLGDGFRKHSFMRLSRTQHFTSQHGPLPSIVAAAAAAVAQVQAKVMTSSGKSLLIACCTDREPLGSSLAKGFTVLGHCHSGEGSDAQHADVASCEKAPESRHELWIGVDLRAYRASKEIWLLELETSRSSRLSHN